MEKFYINSLLRQSEAMHHNLLESFPDSVIIVDDKQRILTVNRRFETMFGYNRSEVIGRPVEMLIPEHFPHRLDCLDGCRLNPGTGSMRHPVDVFALRKGGDEFPIDINVSPIETVEGTAIIATIRDISGQKQNIAQLEYQANHDRLTDLPNRNLLEDRIGQALLQAERFQQLVAVLVIDLDRFEFFLAGLNHDMRDEFFKNIASRLKACVRESDTVARLGDDVFVIVLSHLQENEDAAKIIHKIQNSVNHPVEQGLQVSEISCYIGISVYPKDGREVRTLLKNAEVAMFRAKERGSSCFQYFTDELNDRIEIRMTMERSLRQAVENKEMSVHYQPQMDLPLSDLRMPGMDGIEFSAGSAVFIPRRCVSPFPVMPIWIWLPRRSIAGPFINFSANPLKMKFCGKISPKHSNNFKFHSFTNNDRI